MRLRLVSIAFALVVMAFAGLRLDNDRAIAPHTGSLASSQLSSQPAPDPEPPAIVRAAVTAPATPQTLVGCEPRACERPALDVATDGRQPLREAAWQADRPQTFPLLI